MSKYYKYLGLYPEWPHIEAMRLAIITQLIMKDTIRLVEDEAV